MQRKIRENHWISIILIFLIIATNFILIIGLNSIAGYNNQFILPITDSNKVTSSIWTYSNQLKTP
jgi:hypothetical protein